MQPSEKTRVDEAYATLQRLRGMRVRFTARWTRLDDLEPEAERSLTAALTAAWEDWAREHDITDAQVQGPAVTMSKPDFIPYIDGDLPGS